MRIVFIIAALLIAGAAFSQAKPQQPAKDTAAWQPATDTTEFISIADINAYLVEISGKTAFTPVEFLKFRDAATEIINRAIIRKRKKP
jgi:hypothetical protein